MTPTTKAPRKTTRKPASARPVRLARDEDEALENDTTDPDYGPPSSWPAWTDGHRYTPARR